MPATKSRPSAVITTSATSAHARPAAREILIRAGPTPVSGGEPGGPEGALGVGDRAESRHGAAFREEATSRPQPKRAAGNQLPSSSRTLPRRKREAPTGGRPRVVAGQQSQSLDKVHWFAAVHDAADPQRTEDGRAHTAGGIGADQLRSSNARTTCDRPPPKGSVRARPDRWPDPMLAASRPPREASRRLPRKRAVRESRTTSAASGLVTLRGRALPYPSAATRSFSSPRHRPAWPGALRVGRREIRPARFHARRRGRRVAARPTRANAEDPSTRVALSASGPSDLSARVRWTSRHRARRVRIPAGMPAAAARRSRIAETAGRLAGHDRAAAPRPPAARGRRCEPGPGYWTRGPDDDRRPRGRALQRRHPVRQARNILFQGAARPPRSRSPARPGSDAVGSLRIRSAGGASGMASRTRRPASTEAAAAARRPREMNRPRFPWARGHRG
jgi:hypothetical protein